MILPNPVNDYLAQHHSKYYHYAVGRQDSQQNQHKAEKAEPKNDMPVRTYDYVIGDDSTTNRPDLKLPPLIPKLKKPKNYPPIEKQTNYYPTEKTKNYYIPQRKVPIGQVSH